jgi:hypothetical protein
MFSVMAPQKDSMIVVGLPALSLMHVILICNMIAEVSDALQKLILQHANFDTFIKHYLDRRINVDLLKTHSGMQPEKELMKFASSMSRSIDP